MIPSLFAILVTFLAMRLAGASLDVATILIATTVLGTTENDQIHFFHHLHEGEDGGLEGALRHTLRVSGRPIVFATFINAAGFLALALSSFPPLRQFGIVTAGAFLLAMLADFTLPAALWIARREAPRRSAGCRLPRARRDPRRSPPAACRAAEVRLPTSRLCNAPASAMVRPWSFGSSAYRFIAPAPAWALGGHLRVTRTLPHLRDRSGLDGGTPHGFSRRAPRRRRPSTERTPS